MRLHHHPRTHHQLTAVPRPARLFALTLGVVMLAACDGGPLLPADAGDSSPVFTLEGDPGDALFGPAQFSRASGTPVQETVEVELPEGLDQVAVRLINGASDGTRRVSAATVTVNGEGVIGPADLSQEVPQVLANLPPNARAGTIVIGVQLAGAPGSVITLSLHSGAAVGADGGAFAFDGGNVQVEVPQGAVVEPILLTVAPEAHPHAVASSYTFGPAGAQFEAPLRITLPYDLSTIPAGIDEQHLTVVWDSAGRWIPLADVDLDVAGATVTGSIDHFTSVAVGATEVRACPDQGDPDVATAVSVVASGGVVSLCAGSHVAEDVYLDKAITVQNEPGAAPLIDRGGQYGAFIVTDVAGTSVLIEGLAFENMRYPIYAVGAYDLTVRNSRFQMATGFAYGITSAGVPGSRLTLHEVEMTGGSAAIFAHGGSLVVENSHFYQQSVSNIQIQGSVTDAFIAGNVIQGCGSLACIRTARLLPGALTVLDNEMIHGGNPAWHGILAQGQTVRVEGNRIEATRSPSDPTNPNLYAFTRSGIHVLAGAENTASVSGNTIINAARGITATVAVTGSDNQVHGAWAALAITGAGTMSLNRNDLTDWVNPLVLEDVAVGAEPVAAGGLSCNWWGTASGPAGMPAQVPATAYEPVAPGPIAGTALVCN